MPFKQRTAFQLSLAIAAVVASHMALAQTDQRLWTCNLNASGEWDCEVDENLISTPVAPSLPSASTPDVRPEAQTTPAPTLNPEIEAPAEIEAAEPVAPINVFPEDVGEQTPEPPRLEAQAQTATVQSVRARSGDAFDCRASSDGQWVCEEGLPALSLAQTGRYAADVALQGQSDRLLDNPYAYLDWYPHTGAPGTMLCMGRYVEPEMEGQSDASSPFALQTVFADAINSTSNLQSGLTQLSGGVNLRQGGRSFSSRYGEVDQNNRTAFLQGEVRFREAGLLMVGERVDTDFDTGESRFTQAEYVMHQEHLRGSAERITRYGDERILMEQGALTYCEPGNDAWAIHSKEIELNPEQGYGVARHTTFRIANIPVLYLPWFRFPTDDRRQSGFLYPSIAVSKSDGFDLSVPYYFNIAENMDDTLRVRHIEKRGLLLENEFRYLNEWSMNELNLGYLGNDKRDEGDDRWLLNLRHSGQLANAWETSIDYSRVSDVDYFADLGTDLEVERKEHLDQRWQLRYLANSWQFLANLHEYQTLNENIASPYQRVPQLLFTGQEGLLPGLDLNYAAEFVRFERDRLNFFSDDSINRTTADRVHLRSTLNYDYTHPGAYLRPEFTLWHSQYDFSSPADLSLVPTSVTAGIASLDSGLFLDREFSAAGQGYSQSLEPRLMLLSVNRDKDQPLPSQFNYFDSSLLGFNYYNLFDRYGWSGNDRVSETQQATLGVSSALYSERGLELARIGVAQAHYFSDREKSDLRPGDQDGTESSSNLALLAQWNITPFLRLTHDSEIDRNDYSFEEQNYRLTWLPDDENMFYFSYRDRLNTALANPERIRQSDIAFRSQLTPQWGLIGRWQQDLEKSRKLDTLLGVEYGSCCWKMRLTAREWLSSSNRLNVEPEYDRGLFLQFVLRGLGSFGSEGGRGLIEEVTGFREKDHDNF
ncbi:LPS-assembly protein LptD [Nitrincola tapanii]|nr:LPS assembly protein LptD [Nitrincola tapanii]